MSGELKRRTPCEAESYVLRSFVLACAGVIPWAGLLKEAPSPELIRHANLALDSAHTARVSAEKVER